MSNTNYEILLTDLYMLENDFRESLNLLKNYCYIDLSNNEQYNSFILNINTELVEYLNSTFTNIELKDMVKKLKSSNFDYYYELVELYPKIKNKFNSTTILNNNNNESIDFFMLLYSITNINATEENHMKMLLTHIYTTLDEYLTNVINTLVINQTDLLDKFSVRLKYSDIKNSNEELHLLFIEKILRYDKNLSGIISKIKFIENNVCDGKTNYDKLIEFKEKRDSIVHVAERNINKNTVIITKQYIEEIIGFIEDFINSLAVEMIYFIK